MTEHRIATAEEKVMLHNLFEKLQIHPSVKVSRFIDTRLNKEYDVYWLQDDSKSYLVKKTDESCMDQKKYDIYFKGHSFAVPEIYDTVEIGQDCYSILQCIDGPDARGCSPEEATTIGACLANIQSHYLTYKENPDTAQFYFRYIEKYYEKASGYFSSFNTVWEYAKQRFYEVPLTLIHDDLLPINVLLGADHPWIIDWETAGMYPYFLDLARFAFVTDQKDELYISKEAAMAFLKAYYETMKQNPKFKIEEKQYYLDVAIAAFYQYVMFFYYEEEETIKQGKIYQYLKELITYINRNISFRMVF